MQQRKAHNLDVGKIINGIVCGGVITMGVLGAVDEVDAAMNAKPSEIDAILKSRPEPHTFRSDAGFFGTNYYLTFETSPGTTKTYKISDGFLSLNEDAARGIYDNAKVGQKYRLNLKTTDDFLGLRDRTTIVACTPR